MHTFIVYAWNMRAEYPYYFGPFTTQDDAIVFIEAMPDQYENVQMQVLNDPSNVNNGQAVG